MKKKIAAFACSVFLLVLSAIPFFTIKAESAYPQTTMMPPSYVDGNDREKIVPYGATIPVFPTYAWSRSSSHNRCTAYDSMGLDREEVQTWDDDQKITVSWNCPSLFWVSTYIGDQKCYIQTVELRLYLTETRKGLIPDVYDLERGHEGPAVKNLQMLLKAAGYDTGSTDGIFGGDTEAQVLQFQRDNNLNDDGIVGINTKNPLIRAAIPNVI